MTSHIVATTAQGQIWRATMELAYVPVFKPMPGKPDISEAAMVLHQRWQLLYGGESEWRPVPTLNSINEP